MTTTIMVFSAAVLCGSVGFLGGWYARGKPTDEQVRKYMARFVNLEEIDARERRNMAIMAAGKRRSAPRGQAHGPARVTKVSFRRSGRWD